jgi:hypothetical protein
VHWEGGPAAGACVAACCGCALDAPHACAGAQDSACVVRARA